MKIYDISQEVFGCQVYPGDPVPEKRRLCSIEQGDPCNLTAFSMCAHNGTHIDAPFHFIKDGKAVDSINLATFVGMANVFSASGILLLGNESQTVGPEDAPMEVHLALLGAGIVLLEGIRLAEVADGAYFLNAAPLKLSGADGSPCRAILIAAER